jgi:murein L,D-transpeptidase YcbB/YkuD
MTRRRIVPCIFVATLLLAAASVADAADLSQERIQQFGTQGKLDLDDAQITGGTLIPPLYERFGYQSVWNKDMVEELLTELRAAPTHGLDPADYNLEAIEKRFAADQLKSNDQTVRTDFEMLLTNSWSTYAFVLHYGKLTPDDLDPKWNLSREFNSQDPVGIFEKALRDHNVAEFLHRAAPNHPFYGRTREGLAKYRSIAEAGGWPTIPDGPTLKEGMTDARVATLRKRLQITGDLSGGGDSDSYDSSVKAGIEHFQKRHGIEADGTVGPRTLKELNTPVEARIDQLRCTLERTRWVFRDLEPDYIIVNIATFKVLLFRDNELAWSSNVQVGLPYHSTPVFKDKMEYVVINPTWTIPPGILNKETLPRARKDPNYLKNRNMVVVDGSGNIVDSSKVNSKPFNYSIRQEPGPDNALGRVKFIFPNPYHVYLHDTPAKAKFAEAERAFSHGCVRLENPFELAEILLKDVGWDRAKIDETLDSLKTTNVNLAEPLEVLLLYWTAEVEADGTVRFANDVYERDPKVIKGLNSPFKYVAPEGLPESYGS